MESDETLTIPYGGTIFMPGGSFERLSSEDGCSAFAYRLTKEGPHELEQTTDLAMRINDMMSKQGGAVLAYHYDEDAERDKCSLLLTSELPPDTVRQISKLGFGLKLIKQGCARMKDNPDGTIGGYISLC